MFVSPSDICTLLEMKALIETAEVLSKTVDSDSAYSPIWDKFWELRKSLQLNVEYCDPDTTYEEDIRACWNATLYKLQELGIDLSSLPVEPAHLQDSPLIPFTRFRHRDIIGKPHLDAMPEFDRYCTGHNIPTPNGLVKLKEGYFKVLPHSDPDVTVSLVIDGSQLALSLDYPKGSKYYDKDSLIAEYESVLDIEQACIEGLLVEI